MGSFSSKPKAQPRPPPTLPTDTIVPLGYMDDQDFAKQLVFHITYRFDQVLDPVKLKNALERLVQIGGWRKLGARVRKNDHGKLEYHIPQSFTPSRPAFAYSQVNTGLSIQDHYLARHLPSSNTVDESMPTTLRCPNDFLPLATSDHTPRSVDAWLLSDHPVLSVHVMTFTDATLLSTTTSHALFDALGHAQFMHAWTAVLEGREQDVPAITGFHDDPLDGVESSERYIHHDLWLKGWRWWGFVLNMIYEMVRWPRDSGRSVYLPATFVTKLRERALAELAKTDSDEGEGEEDGGKQAWVSENDILLALLSRTAISALRLPPRTPITLMNVMSYRGVLPSLAKEKAYIGNAMLTSNTFLTAAEILEDDTLARTALQLRKELERQRTLEQVEAHIMLNKASFREDGRPPLFGGAGMVFMALSNWQRGRFFELDFGAACHSGRGGRVKPTYINVGSDLNGYGARNAGAVVGRDVRGGWWLQWTLRDEAWEGFEEALRIAGGGLGGI